jgi:hypothetical protein
VDHLLWPTHSLTSLLLAAAGVVSTQAVAVVPEVFFTRMTLALSVGLTQSL